MSASSHATPGVGSPSAAAPEGERSPFARLTELLAPYQPGKPLITLSLGEPQHPVPDFVGPVLARHVAEFGRYPAAKGIEPQTRKLFEVCRLRDIPLNTFISQLDRDAEVTLALLDEVYSNLQLEPSSRCGHAGSGGTYKRLGGSDH